MLAWYLDIPLTTDVSLYIQSAQKIFGGDVKTHILFFTNTADAGHEANMEQYKKAATGFKGKVSLYCISPCQSLENGTS